jgi:hypothetical protein
MNGVIAIMLIDNKILEEHQISFTISLRNAVIYRQKMEVGKTALINLIANIVIPWSRHSSIL